MTTSISKAVAAVQETLSSWGIPGVVIALTDRQHSLAAVVHGYSDFKARVPLTEQGRFGIGSISKSFTALAVLQLADEGRVDLHAPITRYLPGLALASPFEPISVHHLLSHTSGLPGYLVQASSSRYAMAALRDVVPSYAPGLQAHYSNTGYQLLGYLIENLEDVSFASAMQRRIFDPLEMTSSAAVIDDAECPSMVTSYGRWPDGVYREAPWYEYAAADGSLISTVADMSAYARCLLNRGMAPSGRLLSEAAFKRWMTPVTPEGHAYGLFVSQREGDVRVAHTGAIMGFHSELDVHLDAGFAVVMLSNSVVPRELKLWILDTVSKAFSGGSITAAPSRSQPAKVEEYVGTYRLQSVADDEISTLECVVRDGRLWLKQGQELKQLECMGGDCFRVTGFRSDGVPLFFTRADADTGRGVVGDPFAVSPSEAARKVTDVSHGAKWYLREGLPQPASTVVPRDYAAYVGHFENFCPEGPVIRVFVRNGQLWVMMVLSEKAKPTALIPLGPGTFRLGIGEHNPEYVQFDTLIEGRAMRLTWSGMPLFRRDTH